MRNFLAPFVAAIAIGTFSVAQAQPNTQNTAPMARGTHLDWTKMTPEERRKMVRTTIEDTVRGAMTQLGYTDKALQDEVVATALAGEDALDPVRDAHRKLALSLVANPRSDKDVTTLLADLRGAITQAKTERSLLIKELDERIEFSKKPGLSAFLSLMGITGDESAFIGGITGNFASAMANFSRQLG